MKRIYEVIRQSTTIEFAFIEANNEEEARDFAEVQDIAWESAQTGETHITQIGIAETRLLSPGVTIKCDEGGLHISSGTKSRNNILIQPIMSATHYRKIPNTKNIQIGIVKDNTFLYFSTTPKTALTVFAHLIEYKGDNVRSYH